MASTVRCLSSTIVDGSGRALRQSASTASSQCVTIPTLPPPPVRFQIRAWKTTAHCQKIVRDVAATATGEAPAEVAAAAAEIPEIVKTIQETWDKVEDKYAVTSLAVAGVIALCVLTGMIAAIDRLPLVPGVLELIGIGYTVLELDLLAHILRRVKRRTWIDIALSIKHGPKSTN
ncbi:photosystem I P subunit [Actinidia rufa]|uniref:Photosystem I P subunit n=1 Tax=Actinidia rufa TaxID=165716 RepID=A0A7J0GVA6_9ERIC|nr:photosystem I P subunit [Actinidia rufa]